MPGSGRALPDWVQVPVDMDGAAVALGICRRTLVDLIKDHPHYEPRGIRKVFYPEHIAALREGMKECRSKPKPEAKPASTTPLEPLPESVFERALKLGTKAEQKSLKAISKIASGNVVPMEKRRSGHSRKLR